VRSIRRTLSSAEVAFSSEGDEAELAVNDLTTLTESRDWKSVAGDAALVATLMNVLSTILLKRQSIREGVDYLEQETLGAILALIEKIAVR
jgi:U3 small nucleolar RNA-associated protein 10